MRVTFTAKKFDMFQRRERARAEKKKKLKDP